MFVTTAPNEELKPSADASSRLRSPAKAEGLLSHPDEFPRRHIGPSAEETRQMLDLLGYPSLDALIEAAVPARILIRDGMAFGRPTRTSQPMGGPLPSKFPS